MWQERVDVRYVCMRTTIHMYVSSLFRCSFPSVSSFLADKLEAETGSEWVDLIRRLPLPSSYTAKNAYSIYIGRFSLTYILQDEKPVACRTTSLPRKFRIYSYPTNVLRQISFVISLSRDRILASWERCIKRDFQVLLPELSQVIFPGALTVVIWACDWLSSEPCSPAFPIGSRICN